MLGRNIRRLRKSAGYTQCKLAQQLGISTSAVGMYEQGRRDPDPQMLLKISQALGTTVDILLSETEREIELEEMVDNFLEKLMLERTIIYNGKPLGKKERQSIIKTIKLGVEFAARDIEDNE